jgi:Ser/Thr protein kinase RdoA (MazF antagonist)
LQNQNAKVSVDGVDYVIKRYDQDRMPALIQLSHSLQLRLFKAGFPVARLECLDDGNSLFYDGQYAYSVHRWVSGHHFEFPNADGDVPAPLLEEVARVLGLLHSVTIKECPYAGETTASEMMAQELLSSRPERKKNWFKLVLRLKRTKLEREVLAAWGPIRQLARRLAITHENFGEMLLVHNDINWQNIIFDESDKLLALIDFDNIRYAPRALEIGYAALVLVGAHDERLKQFVRVYSEVAGVSVDLDAVKLAMRIRCLRSYNWVFQTVLNHRIGDQNALLIWVRYLHVCALRLL